MINWTVVFETLAVSLGGAGTVGFLAKVLTEQFLQKDLERFKIDLAHASDLDIERRRAEYTQRSLEHQIRFSTLHDRQATIIAEVYANLDALHLAFRRWASFIQVGDDAMLKHQEATSLAFQHFVSHYHPNALWLDRATCNSINSIVDTLNTAFGDLAYQLNDKGFPKDLAQWKRANDAVNVSIPQARALLETRFRAILGIPDSAMPEDPPDAKQPRS